MILAGGLSHRVLFWTQTVYQHWTFRRRREAERKQPWSSSRELLWVDPDCASAKCKWKLFLFLPHFFIPLFNTHTYSSFSVSHPDCTLPPSFSSPISLLPLPLSHLGSPPALPSLPKVNSHVRARGGGREGRKVGGNMGGEEEGRRGGSKVKGGMKNGGGWMKQTGGRRREDEAGWGGMMGGEEERGREGGRERKQGQQSSNQSRANEETWK